MYRCIFMFVSLYIYLFEQSKPINTLYQLSEQRANYNQSNCCRVVLQIAFIAHKLRFEKSITVTAKDDNSQITMAVWFSFKLIRILVCDDLYLIYRIWLKNIVFSCLFTFILLRRTSLLRQTNDVLQIAGKIRFFLFV